MQKRKKLSCHSDDEEEMIEMDNQLSNVVEVVDDKQKGEHPSSQKNQMEQKNQESVEVKQEFTDPDVNEDDDKKEEGDDDDEDQAKDEVSLKDKLLQMFKNINTTTFTAIEQSEKDPQNTKKSSRKTSEKDEVKSQGSDMDQIPKTKEKKTIEGELKAEKKEQPKEATELAGKVMHPKDNQSYQKPEFMDDCKDIEGNDIDDVKDTEGFFSYGQESGNVNINLEDQQKQNNKEHVSQAQKKGNFKEKVIEDRNLESATENIKIKKMDPDNYILSKEVRLTLEVAKGKIIDFDESFCFKGTKEIKKQKGFFDFLRRSATRYLLLNGSNLVICERKKLNEFRVCSITPLSDLFQIYLEKNSTQCRLNFLNKEHSKFGMPVIKQYNLENKLKFLLALRSTLNALLLDYYEN